MKAENTIIIFISIFMLIVTLITSLPNPDQMYFRKDLEEGMTCWKFASSFQNGKVIMSIACHPSGVYSGGNENQLTSFDQIP